jgi:predicted Fe-S protein YdhL (DUF1289 family)
MPVPSPCKLICRYDEDGICVGCRRNREEITYWITYSDKQKLEVYKQIQVRKSGNSNTPGNG